MELDQQQPELELELASGQLIVKHRLSQVRKQIKANVIVQHHIIFRVDLLPEQQDFSAFYLFTDMDFDMMHLGIFTKKETLWGESNSAIW